MIELLSIKIVNGRPRSQMNSDVDGGSEKQQDENTNDEDTVTMTPIEKRMTDILNSKR